MTRLLEPSEAYHAFLDWQTGFAAEVPASVTPAAAAGGLRRMYSSFPRLGGRIARTADGFAFEETGTAPAVETDAGDVRVDTALSAFTVGTARPGVTEISGRLHHALCDVTGILSILDHLLGELGAGPGAGSIPPETARDWPIAAERVFGVPQPAGALRETRLFFGEAPAPPLKPARPATLHLEAPRVRAIDDVCAAESVSLTAVIAVAAAPFTGDGEGRRVGVPVDCRVFADPLRAGEFPLRAIGNCSHGALMRMPRPARTVDAVLAAAREYDAELMDQIEAVAPTAPFLDGRRYLPENNLPAHLVVSNARGATRRFPRLATAGRLLIAPQSSIPALPMIAVNESPATGAVDITLIADPADLAPGDVRAVIDAVAHTLTQIGERQ
ncbi:hypothetical protein [Actinomadura sp. DC4]|uniref:hypothetical protein n=1 Tax=Actinomadura sp. DC4 TaxID=3055069 RepID=UPI0025AF87C8|nr:hypothetical protein [Actinomadura sp. DC4]MDN3353230.1 hypothetical protein [Actinomadura sp. DC4]